MGPLSVVAMGGHSLLDPRQEPSVENQFSVTAEAVRPIARLLDAGQRLLLTHGNGPQVGFLKRRIELSSHQMHDVPLDALVADTQGSLGYMIQRELRLACTRPHSVIALVTEVEVDPLDTAFEQPTKGIGRFYNAEEAVEHQRSYGWHMREDAGRGWRRLVPSPRPKRILQLNSIQSLLLSGTTVIACGGGGIPVAPDSRGDLMGLEAVIDKDLSSALLANILKAERLFITTEVEAVYIGFGTERARALGDVSLEEIRDHQAAGEFPVGSMGPKIQAAVEFLERGGASVSICRPKDLEAAFRGEAGTRIVREL